MFRQLSLKVSVHMFGMFTKFKEIYTMDKYNVLHHVFKGWYRKSLSRKGTVWHRVYQVDSVPSDKQMAHTVCGRHITTIKCDFDIKPDHKCMQCEKSPRVVVETSRGFVPVGSTSILTKTAAIVELKRLLRQRTYYLRIFGIYGVKIKARWTSDTSIDIDTETKIIIKRREKNVLTLHEIQADLGRFKSSIDHLCDATTVLARQEKEKKKKLMGYDNFTSDKCLTEEEDQAYFEKLLYQAEK